MTSSVQSLFVAWPSGYEIDAGEIPAINRWRLALYRFRAKLSGIYRRRLEMASSDILAAFQTVSTGTRTRLNCLMIQIGLLNELWLWFMNWLIDSLIDWLFGDLLIDWLTDWLVQRWLKLYAIVYSVCGVLAIRSWYRWWEMITWPISQSLSVLKRHALSITQFTGCIDQQPSIYLCHWVWRQ